MESVVNALNKSLTLKENTTSDVKYITLSTIPTVGAPANIAWSKGLLPVAVIVGNTQLASGASFTTSSAVEVQWLMASATTLSITNVVGITPTNATQYVLTLVCIAG